MQKMLALATKVRENAYAPYSNFKVGAVVKSKTGKLYFGCNVENSSYGLSICAERAAIFTALAAGETKLTELLLVTEVLATPCGACRQVLQEFNFKKIHVADLKGQIRSYTLAELLPEAFSENYLEETKCKQS